MIVGMDLMTEIGMIIDLKDKVIRWENNAIPLKQRDELKTREQLYAAYQSTTLPTRLQEAEERHARILDANYDKVNADEFVDAIDDLNEEEKEKLKQTLHKYPQLFGGGLGTLNIAPVHLEIRPDAKAYHARAFPIPQALYATTRKEMDRLTGIGVFAKDNSSEWAAPTFVQPKKTGDVRILTDFRKLNECLVRKPFPLPKISELMQKLSGFKYTTAIDLSMGYYHIPLDEESQRLCTTVLPWGKYKYTRLPMGIMNSPDIFQAVIQELLGDLDFVQAYLDDILITNNGTYDDHIEKVNIVLKRLEEAGFRANLRKCFFARDSLEYLGYILNRNGLTPQPKKVEAILRLSPPKNKRQLRHFLGMVNFYRDMWRRRSHVLSPLTRLTGDKVKWQWGNEEQSAFDEMKKVISKEALLAFPGFNKEFHVYTDASDYQLGAVIMQDNKPLAFYSRKLNSAQKRYTTGEQELLSIVETLKEFKNILWGQNLTVHTDHKNILYSSLPSDRIMRWRLLLEEFGAKFMHVKGTDNIVADALSRLDAKFDNEPAAQMTDEKGVLMAHAMATFVRDEIEDVPTTKTEIAEAFGATKDELLDEAYPLSPQILAREQHKDKQLKLAALKNPQKFSIQTVEHTDLITENGKIYVPTSLRQRAVAWYHEYYCHPGQTRMEASLRQIVTWPHMRETIARHIRSCKKCQMHKRQRKKYGTIPPKVAEPAVPWNRVNVDMVGPWTIKAQNGEFTFRALTMIDPATGWFEVGYLRDQTADCCLDCFDKYWLSRYPRPEYIGFDNGNEYKAVFDMMIRNYQMKRKPSTEYNPQSNGIIERVHQVMADALRTKNLADTYIDPNDPFASQLSSVGFAIRSTYHTTLEASPAQLVFGRDMLLPIKFTVDWAMIKQKRQNEMNKNNQRENKARIPHNYNVGDKILLQKPGILPKMETRRQGPYKVDRVFSNGTLRIRRGAIREVVNIRRVTPFIEEPNLGSE